ncbi:MAG: response regulator [Kofleriaceae bacterium]
MSKLSVLVVDDELDVLEYVEDLLTADGHHVTKVYDPREALTKLRDETFHVVLLDLAMQELGGLELLAKLREIDDDVAVIILTADPAAYRPSAPAARTHKVTACIDKCAFAEHFRDAFAMIIREHGIVPDDDDEVLRQLGQRVRTLRRDRLFTLRDLCSRTSLDTSLLSQIERAECSASVSTLWRIASALNVPLVELFRGSEAPSVDGPR